MTDASVTSLACGVRHPSGITCNRQRGHRGSHIGSGGTGDGTTWHTCPDARNAMSVSCELVAGHDGDHRATLPSGGLYEWHTYQDVPPGAVYEDAELLEAPRLIMGTPHDLERLRKNAVAVLALVFLLLLVTAPALVVAAWRAAL